VPYNLLPLPYQKPKASNFGHKHIEENINQIIFS